MNNNGLTLNQLSERNAALVTEVEKLRAERDRLAAENVALKKSAPAPFSKLMMEALDTYHSKADDVPELAMLSAYVKLRDGLKTPATDRIVAGIKADGVEEFSKTLEGAADICGKSKAWEAQENLLDFAERGFDFAKQLREGAK
ncbi:hypothetical protein [Klebsiella pneumoniae]|uniref:hypothetical protein n=1 Tax=Klebsiella pneumoniae TaxID=573 RepID=UPI000CAABC88|nr:hypothetical protein [Klebsiella pneumoniae]MBZ1869106.1 hypothetical protein [Klebsiella pneumoniae]PLE76277.1 hypothetical protein B6I77_05615 [Klebsiella pneumoniae]PLH13831.1 hypothetical protein B6J23_23490 [Klebsiella pneumoniae]QPV94693.1 hypothetical protein I8N74_06355 [Klebsiella pneumoniae]HEN7306893.1 hypothetical protein [Klebsiella pneumoniae]